MPIITPQLPLSAKIFSPPPKKVSSRDREYLRPSEVHSLIRAAQKIGRHPLRDNTIILLMFRHGLRAAALCSPKMVTN